MIIESIQAKCLSTLTNEVIKYLKEFNSYKIEISDPRKEKDKWIISFIRRK